MNSNPDEHALDAIIAEYLEAQERGEDTRPSRWIERHPEHAEALREFFAAELRFDRVTPRPQPSSTPMFACDDRFGDYDILAPIARGGMGVVYRARQRSLDREVALKMILGGQWARPAERERFAREAAAIAGLDHPHIVPVYEVGEVSNIPYFAMRLLPGGSLVERLPELRRDPTRTAELVEQLARAVHFAHQAGILHRDLKPANILFDANGSPQISDFGLAKSTAPTDELTLTGAALGTPSYMAPEQVTGDVGFGADIYALGCILYEILTGRPPFVGQTVFEVMQQLRRDPPLPPRQRDPRIPRDLETITLVCLEKDPARRYANAEELAEELARFRRHEPIHSRPIPRVARLYRWTRRNPVASILFTSLVVITAISVVASLITESERQDAVDAAARAHRAERASQARLRESLRVQVAAWTASGKEGQRTSALAALARAAAIPPSATVEDDADPDTNPERTAEAIERDALDLRNAAAHAAALIDLAVADEDPSQPIGTVLSGDGEASAWPEPDGSLSVDLAGERQPIAVEGRRLETPRFHSVPDSSAGAGWLLSATDRRASTTWVWRVAPQTEPELRFEVDGCLGSVEVLTDETDERPLLVAAVDARELHVYRAGQRDPIRRRLLRDRISRLAASSDHASIAVSYFTERTLDVFRRETLDPIRSIANGSPINDFVWLETPGASTLDRSRESLLVGDTGGGVRLVDVDTGRATTLGRVGPPILAVARSPNSSYGVAYSADGRLRLWELGEVTPILETRWERDSGPEFKPHIHFERNGRGLVVEHPRRRPRRATLLVGPVRTVFDSGDTVHSLDIDPSGTLLAIGSERGLAIHDLRRRTRLAALPIGAVRQVVFLRARDSLWTVGAGGVHEWPLAPRADGAFELGAPIRCSTPRGHGALALGADALRMAYVETSHHHGTSIAIVDSLPAFEPTLTLDHPTVRSLSLSPDGTSLVSAAWRGRDIKWWNLTTDPVTSTTLLEGDVNAHCLIADSGVWVAAASPDFVRAWRLDPATGRLDDAKPALTFPREDPESSPAQLAFPARSTDLLAAVSSDIRIYDLRSRSLVTRLPDFGGRGLRAVAFDPSGRYLVVAGRRLERWDLRALRDQWQALGLSVPPSFAFDDAPGPETPRLELAVGSFFDPSAWVGSVERDFAEAALDHWAPRAQAAPGDFDAGWCRVWTLIRLGRKGEALLELDRLLPIAGVRTAEVELRRGNLLEDQCAYDRALESYTQAETLAIETLATAAGPPASMSRVSLVRWEAVYRRAIIHERRGAPDAAEPLYREIIAASPDSLGAWHRLAWLHSTSQWPARDLDFALHAAERAYRGSDQWDYALAVGLAHVARGEAEAAVPYLERALREVPNDDLDPSHPARPDLAVLALSTALLDLGRDEVARELFEEIRTRAEPRPLLAEPADLRRRLLEAIGRRLDPARR